MMIHHDRHHAAYVNVCNEFAKEVPALGTTPIEKTLADPPTSRCSSSSR